MARHVQHTLHGCSDDPPLRGKKYKSVIGGSTGMPVFRLSVEFITPLVRALGFISSRGGWAHRYSSTEPVTVRGWPGRNGFRAHIAFGQQDPAYHLGRGSRSAIAGVASAVMDFGPRDALYRGT